jgi:hypothetical protein
MLARTGSIGSDSNASASDADPLDAAETPFATSRSTSILLPSSLLLYPPLPRPWLLKRCRDGGAFASACSAVRAVIAFAASSTVPNKAQGFSFYGSHSLRKWVDTSVSFLGPCPISDGPLNRLVSECLYMSCVTWTGYKDPVGLRAWYESQFYSYDLSFHYFSYILCQDWWWELKVIYVALANSTLAGGWTPSKLLSW